MSLEVQYFPITNKKEKIIVVADDRVLSLDNDTSKSDNLDNDTSKSDNLDNDEDKNE